MQGLKSPNVFVRSNISAMEVWNNENIFCLIGNGKQYHSALCWKCSPIINLLLTEKCLSMHWHNNTDYFAVCKKKKSKVCLFVLLAGICHSLWLSVVWLDVKTTLPHAEAYSYFTYPAHCLIPPCSDFFPISLSASESRWNGIQFFPESVKAGKIWS